MRNSNQIRLAVLIVVLLTAILTPSSHRTASAACSGGSYASGIQEITEIRKGCSITTLHGTSFCPCNFDEL